MLKRKTLLNYRKALDRRIRCKTCIHRKFIDIHNCSGNDVIEQGWRCEQIGLENSRRYSIAINHVYNEFKAGGENA